MYLITRHDDFHLHIEASFKPLRASSVGTTKVNNVNYTLYFVDVEDPTGEIGENLFFFGFLNDYHAMLARLQSRGGINATGRILYNSIMNHAMSVTAVLDDTIENLSVAFGLGSALSKSQDDHRQLMSLVEQHNLEVDGEEELKRALLGMYKEFMTIMSPRIVLEGIKQRGQGVASLGGVMTDTQIANAVLDHDMINPFYTDTVREVDGQPVISFGLGTMGYDTRLRPIFKLFKKNPTNGAIDPKAFDERHVEIVEGAVIELPPKTYALSETVECFNMPNDVMAFCLAKSTYARCCIGVNTTPIWPGFKGHVVIEFYNHGDVPVKIYANEGFAQFVFMRASETVKHNYADRGGVYHGQETGVQSAKVGKK